MTVFLAIGGIGLAVLLLTLLVGDALDGLFDAFDGFDIGGGGFLTGPAMGAFLASFGFGGALIQYSTEASTVVSAFGGVGSGLVVGGVVGMVTKTLMELPTDASVRSTDLVGDRATVVTPIPAGGIGEVNLTHQGHLMKLSARSSAPVGAGVEVEITSVMSSSQVMVKPVAEP